MTENVHVLVSCRTLELQRASLAFLDTIRIGFPDAKISVMGNRLPVEIWAKLEYGCELIGAKLSAAYCRKTHPSWIESLIDQSSEPFWICDTDIVFHGNVERFSNELNAGVTGRHTPRFVCPFTKSKTHERLHTSLMRIDPLVIEEKLKTWRSDKIESFQFTRAFNDVIYGHLVAQSASVTNGEVYFHDTTSQLYHAIGGQSFTPDLLDQFTHANCGTYSDLVDPSGGFTQRNLAIFDNPDSARGAWRAQDEWYASNSW